MLHIITTRGAFPAAIEICIQCVDKMASVLTVLQHTVVASRLCVVASDFLVPGMVQKLVSHSGALQSPLQAFARWGFTPSH
jgi:hypothetical protein